MLRVPFLDLRRQVDAMDDELSAAMERTVASGKFVLGPAVEALESEFARWCGARRAVGVASGTDAIALALSASGIGPGDEVIAPANTFAGTVAGISAAGATPVLADVEPGTLTIAPASVESVISERTRALVPVHLYGQCADMDALAAVAERHGLRVIEDAAQAHGATYGRERAGTLGDAAAFSFYPTKNLGALGDGGAIVTDDDAIADRALMIRNYGFSERDNALIGGRNSRLDEIQAAILLAKLPHVERWNDRRRELAEKYMSALRPSGLTLPTVAKDRSHAWYLFVVRVPARDAVRSALRERGIETLMHYPRPIHGQPAYADIRRASSLAESEAACAEVLSLPLYPELTDEEQAAVIDAVGEAAVESGA